MRRFVTLVLLTLVVSLPAVATTVTIEAGRDVTLVQTPDGSLANGSGPAIFVGRTAQDRNSIRRALLYFDVASALPENAIIDEVWLTLYLAPSNPGPQEIRIHRVQSDWGEGASSSSGGGGKPSQPGDSTWIHTFYDHEFWGVPGGRFIGRASASKSADDTGFYTWRSTNHLVQDVRFWNHAPHRNFGWILIGDETISQNAKAFASREEAMIDLRPRLTVTYRLPGNRRGAGPP
jgi:hypothetical protein